jgi:hypothetical protein
VDSLYVKTKFVYGLAVRSAAFGSISSVKDSLNALSTRCFRLVLLGVYRGVICILHKHQWWDFLTCWLDFRTGIGVGLAPSKCLSMPLLQVITLNNSSFGHGGEEHKHAWSSCIQLELLRWEKAIRLYCSIFMNYRRLQMLGGDDNTQYKGCTLYSAVQLHEEKKPKYERKFMFHSCSFVIIVLGSTITALLPVWKDSRLCFVLISTYTTSSSTTTSSFSSMNNRPPSSCIFSSPI